MTNKLDKKIEEIKGLHLEAFGKEEGPIIEKLVEEFLLRDDSISISIEEDNKIIGNVIFSPFQLVDYPQRKYFLLAPLGVLPKFQGKGIGRKLIEKGVEHLRGLGGEAVFVLGYPDYYASRGFKATTIISPYFELMNFSEAWRVLEIKKGAISDIKGASIASPPIMKSMFWDTTGRG